MRAVADLVSITAFNNKRSAGKLQTYFGERPYISMPDASYALDVNFASEARDYWRDPMLLKATEEGTAILDEDKRKSLYREAFDRINNEYYMVPISSLPQTFVHAKGLAVTASPSAPFNVDISAFSWK